MRDISSPILHADACDQFEAEILPFIQEQYEQDGEPDWPARRESGNITTGVSRAFAVDPRSHLQEIEI